jgi:nitrogen fixation/metabolism regulation signal transduction histidine kinase
MLKTALFRHILISFLNVYFQIEMKITRKQREKSELDQKLSDLCSDLDRKRRLHAIMADEEADMSVILKNWMAIKFSDKFIKPVAELLAKAKAKLTE